MSAFNPSPPTQLPATYWLTRDRLNGLLSQQVEVWSGGPPSRHRFRDRDVVWLPREAERVRMIGTWSMPEAQERRLDIPDSDIVCTRVPPEAPRDDLGS